jgi:hypothetical protein
MFDIKTGDTSTIHAALYVLRKQRGTGFETDCVDLAELCIAARVTPRDRIPSCSEITLSLYASPNNIQNSQRPQYSMFHVHIIPRG